MTTGEQYAAAIAAQLRAEKAASQLSVEQVATRAGISRGTFHRYMSGERDIPMSVLVMLAEALDVSLAQLVARAEERIVNDAGQADAS